MPPHTIEYHEPKGKEEVLEYRGLEEEEDDFVDDVVFPQSESRHDDRFPSTIDRYPVSGNAIDLLYCPSNDSLGSSMMMASHGELLSSSAKHKKQAPKAQLNEAEEAGQEGFRSRGSTMAHGYGASKAEPVKLGLPKNRKVRNGPESIDKAMAKRDTPPKADGKKGRSASGGYFAFKSLSLGSIRSNRVFKE